MARGEAGRERREPGAAAVDSQSVKTTEADLQRRLLYGSSGS